MRAGDPAAFREFVARFRPLLRATARRLDAPLVPGDDLVEELLGDAALALTAAGARTPRSLAAYLVASLRHRFLNAERERRRRQASAERAWGTAEGSEGVVESTYGEATLRASRGAAGADAAPGGGALGRLAEALLAPLGETERALLVWASHDVPHREIARWLGITHAAARKRVERLRERLRADAVRYAAGASAADRAVLERFFRRAGGAALGHQPRAHSAAAVRDGGRAAGAGPSGESPSAARQAGGAESEP
jgi:DNA-directed RNA polymerase specialized sigma24 family protein